MSAKTTLNPLSLEPSPSHSDASYSDLGDSHKGIPNSLKSTPNIQHLSQQRENSPLGLERMRDLIDRLPVLIAYIDRNGFFRFSSRQHQSWWGRPENQIVGYTHREVTGEINHQFCKSHLGRALSGIPVTFETPAYYPGVGEKFVQSSYIPDFSPSGDVLGVFVLVTDLTTINKTERELRRQEHEQKIIFDSVPAYIWYKDTENRILRVNKAAAESIGLPVSGIEGRHTREIYPDHTDKYHIDDLEVIGSGQPKLGIVEPITIAGGTTRWLRTDKVPYFDDRGKVTGVIVFAIDITDRIKAEQDRSVLEQQLLQSQKMEALGTLAGGIAHDFNNVLAGILGYVGLAQLEVQTNSPLNEYLQKIDGSVQRARDLVHQILTFSRHSDSIERQVIEAKLLTLDVLALVKASCAPNITVSTQFSAKQMLLSVNPAQMHQVLLNVLTNAVYSMKDKGGLLEVIVAVISGSDIPKQESVIESDRNYIHFLVRDSGCGMSEEVQKRIFEPYFTTKPTGEGSGLGLSVVHGIILSLGGSIQVESELGNGTDFHIYLPASNVALSEDAQIAEESGRNILYQRGEGRVIFIDDEPMLAQLGQVSLTALGYNVDCFLNCTDALFHITSNPEKWDLIITDQTMPGMGGDVFIRQVREILPNIPIILCTGYSETVCEQRAQESGASAFLIKPYSLDKLATLCFELCAERKQLLRKSE